MSVGRAAYPPARLYEAILHLRRLGHAVSSHDRRRRLHRVDDAILTEEALLERAMRAFRPKVRGGTPASCGLERHRQERGLDTHGADGG